jgi:uncharacterized protein YbaA (DUF1428 family)
MAKSPTKSAKPATGNYVDGFVIPVPQKKLPEYLRMARLGARVWKDHGALQYIECVADDVPPGKWTSFPRAVKAKPGETIVFAWIVYRSKASRDRINAKAMADPRLAGFDPKTMPFDGKRMIFGGFRKKVTG